ncbi:MAG: YncE family protein, partial [Vicinamibacterales bacterium]
MLSFRRIRHEAILIERYWLALRGNRATPVPDDLDPELAGLIAEVERNLAPPRLSNASIEQIWRRVDARAPETTQRAWSGPALDPAARRRTGAPPINEREEQRAMSELSPTTDVEPIPIQQRRWPREALKLAAAAIVFIAIGAILALTLRGDDSEPTFGPSGPTPTPTPIVTPSALATPSAAATQAVVQPSATALAPTPSASPSPSPAITLTSVEPIVTTIQVGQDPRELAVGFGSVWVTNSSDGTVSRIDPATNTVIATIVVSSPGNGTAEAIVADDTAVWVIGGAQP